MIHRISFISSALKTAAVVAGFFVALGLPALAQAQTLQIPLLKFHALTGTWWAKTLYDETGTAEWHGGQDGQRVMLRVDLKGSFGSTFECNGIFGQFETAEEDGAVSVNAEGIMSTLMGCFGEYPPSIRLSDIARYEREDLELRFYDENDLPVAVFYNVQLLQQELAEVLGG